MWPLLIPSPFGQPHSVFGGSDGFYFKCHGLRLAPSRCGLGGGRVGLGRRRATRPKGSVRSDAGFMHA